MLCNAINAGSNDDPNWLTRLKGRIYARRVACCRAEGDEDAEVWYRFGRLLDRSLAAKGPSEVRMHGTNEMWAR